MKTFDLNIEKVLGDWEIYHAVREVIANAIDERVLTNTPEIKVEKRNDEWIIRDFGRGLKIEHFTQNESAEKINHSNLIGKFGVGLKDAIAVFSRNHCKVEIISKYGKFTFTETSKHDFEDVITLHVQIEQSTDTNFVGTEFILGGVQDDYIKQAKGLFLCFLDKEVLETTKYGQVLPRGKDESGIYVNGVQVSTESNFMFAYNITSIDSKIKRSLNRERTNVGRSAYTDRIKSILLECISPTIMDSISEGLSKYGTGEEYDEIGWKDVGLHATKILSANGDYVMVSTSQLRDMNPELMDILREKGGKILSVPDNVACDLDKITDLQGKPITTGTRLLQEYQTSFEYKFVDYSELTDDEKAVFDSGINILGHLDLGQQKSYVYISETLAPELNFMNPVGVWDRNENKIIILRKQLRRKEDFFGTLLHEICHKRSGAYDGTREFEEELTKLIGVCASRLLGEATVRRNE